MARAAVLAATDVKAARPSTAPPAMTHHPTVEVAEAASDAVPIAATQAAVPTADPVWRKTV